MIRLLLIIAIAVVAWYLYRRIVLGAGSSKPSAPPAPPATSEQDTVTRCEECGVHVPEKNGVRYQGQFFCSPEHLTENLRKRGQS